MAIAEHPFICDSCGKDRRKDTNHWFILWIAEMGPFQDTIKPGLVIEPFSLERAVGYGKRHTCGVSCAIRLTERYLTIGQFEVVTVGSEIPQ